MMQRPFRLHRARSSSRDVIELNLTFAEPLPSDQEGIDRRLGAVKAWCEVGALGGLAGESLEPARSGIVLESRTIVGSDAVKYQFRDVRIDPRGIFLLENALHSMDHRIASLREVAIASALTASLETIGDELPSFYEPVPFSYTYEVTDVPMWIEIEFQQDVPRSVLKTVESAAEVWAALGNVGGFTDPGMLPHESYIYLDDVDYDSDMLTLHIPGSRVSDLAIDSLVNILNQIHHKLTPINSVRFS